MTLAKYRKKPVVIDAITFDELTEHGKRVGGEIVNGLPWSFEYRGHPIMNENSNCYLVQTSEGAIDMTQDDMLVVGSKGEIYPCKKDIFDATYFGPGD